MDDDLDFLTPSLTKDFGPSTLHLHSEGILLVTGNILPEICEMTERRKMRTVTGENRFGFGFVV